MSTKEYVLLFMSALMSTAEYVLLFISALMSTTEYVPLFISALMSTTEYVLLFISALMSTTKYVPLLFTTESVQTATGQRALILPSKNVDKCYQRQTSLLFRDSDFSRTLYDSLYCPKQPESQKIVTTESFLLFFCLLIRQPDGIARWRQTEARKSHNNPHSIISHVFVFFGQILVLFNNYNCDSDSFNLDSVLYRKILSKIQSIFMNTFSAMQIF